MTTVDLRQYKFLIPEYVSMRNRYVSELMTIPITLEMTIDWLDARPSKGMVFCVLSGNSLVGAFIISFERRQEFSVFVDKPGTGTGRFILGELERVCRSEGISKIWARIRDDNVRAKAFFDKYFTRTALGWEKTFETHN